MARRDDDRFDDEDDVMDRPRAQPSKGGFPVWAIVLVCAVPLVLIGLVVVGGALFWARSSAKVEQAEVVQADTAALGPAKAGMKKVYTRDEFKAMIGATPQDVTAALGEPHIKIAGNNRTTWHYQNKTINPATGKIDSVALVVFEGDVVVEVNF